MTEPELPSYATVLADRYRLEREAGSGGMATVYLAQDIRHDRQVAIKVLHPELSAMLGADRFLAEIKTTAALQHPHILPLFDSGSADGHLFYVMPFIEGETLRSRLSREKQLPIADAVRITREVASALDYAHRRGVIHRDIKPENILLHEGQALVADFGIALAVQSAGGQRMTQTGLSLGTPQYMSPEQAMGEREITARSDVYSLGAVAYEMLVGEAPFTGPTAQSIVAKVMTEDARPLIPQRKSIPPYVEAAVLTAIQKLPADRFGTAAEFAAALDASGGHAHATASVRAPDAPRASRMRQLAPWMVAVAALVAGVAGGRSLLAKPASAPSYAQKTFDDKVVSLARFSPDGRTLVFSAGTFGELPELYVIRPDYAEPQLLGDAPMHLLSVSSQGELAVLVRPRYLAFKTYTGTLARMSIGGGAPREMVDSIRDADWAPDGVQPAFVRSRGGRDFLEYPAGKVLVESGGYLTDPRFAPDGRSIAFVEHPWRFDDRGTINVVYLDGHRTTLSADEYSKINGVSWARDGADVFFSANVPTTHQEVILAVSARGGVARTALNGAGNLVMEDIAADGRWLVVRDVSRIRLMMHRAADTVARDVGWLDYPFEPAISHDGELVAFGEASSESGVDYSVFLRRTSGGKAVRLGSGFPQQFSSDGRSLLSLVPSRPGRLVIYPTGAGTERTVNAGDLDALDAAGWGPRDESVWYCGRHARGARVCRSTTLAGGSPKDIPPLLGYSPDGRLMLVRMRGGGLMVASSGGDSLNVVPGIGADDVFLRWSPDNRALWMLHADGAIAVDVASGGRTPVVSGLPTTMASGVQLRALAIADDPRTYAFQPHRLSSELYLVSGAR